MLVLITVALGIHIKSLGGGGITRYLGIALKYFARKKLIKRDKENMTKC